MDVGTIPVESPWKEWESMKIPAGMGSKLRDLVGERPDKRSKDPALLLKDLLLRGGLYQRSGAWPWNGRTVKALPVDALIRQWSGRIGEHGRGLGGLRSKCTKRSQTAWSSRGEREALAGTPLETLREEARRLADKVQRSGVRGALGPVLLIAGVLGTYEAIRYRVLGGIPQALENGSRIWRLERFLGLPNESLIQNWALGRPSLVTGANWFYLAGHFPVTSTTLAWVYWQRRSGHQQVIHELLLVTAAAFGIMLTVPLAPPRLLDGYGFTDTMAVFGPHIYGSPQVEATVNQYAAMPSLHVGWSLWVAWTLIQMTGSPWRWLILAHPTLTLAVVIVTANHFWLDGAAGAALLAASIYIIRNRWFLQD